jgi:hypothetical protein
VNWSDLAVGLLASATTLAIAIWQIKRNNKKIREDTTEALLHSSDGPAQRIIDQLQEQQATLYKEFSIYKKEQADRNDRRDKEIERLRVSEGAWRNYSFQMERWANKAYMLLSSAYGDADLRIEPIPQAPSRLR